MKKLVAFNWKCNPPSVDGAKKLLRSLSIPSALDVVICPPFPFLHFALPKGARRGAQDLFWEGGSYTGEVSASMLKSLGVAYVIVGHSERRRVFEEADDMIARKVRAALAEGLKVILCVGEDRTMHRKGVSAVERFVRGQLTRSLRGVSRKLTKNLVIAYEPVWAIGSGNAAVPGGVSHMLRSIKTHLRVSYRVRYPVVLYGGSVTSRNAGDFVHYGDVDGFLVGGASLKPREVEGILRAASDPRR